MDAGHLSDVRLTRSGGVFTVHRFGEDGDWSRTAEAGIVLTAEVIAPGPDLHCPHCRSWVTGLRSGGEVTAAGITHSPGCPWLTEMAR